MFLLAVSVALGLGILIVHPYFLFLLSMLLMFFFASQQDGFPFLAVLLIRNDIRKAFRHPRLEREDELARICLAFSGLSLGSLLFVFIWSKPVMAAVGLAVCVMTAVFIRFNIAKSISRHPLITTAQTKVPNIHFEPSYHVG